MKRWISLLLIATLCAMMAACGNGSTATGSAASSGRTASAVASVAAPSAAPASSEATSSIDWSRPWREHPQDYKLIALTFDDAPFFSSAQGNVTVRILDAVTKYDGTGTLFVNGKNVKEHGTALLEEAMARGFEIGNHGMNHAVMTKYERDAILREIEGNQTYLKETLGVEPRFFRAGNLVYNQEVYNVCHELGLPAIAGTGFYDYDKVAEHDSTFIYNKAMTDAKDGAIFLLHSWSDKTGAVIEDICRDLYEQGYRFCTLSELFEYRNVDVFGRWPSINHQIYDTTLLMR